MPEKKKVTKKKYEQLELVEVSDGTEASENAAPLEPTLKTINLNIKPGEFVCVVGEIGSGKSSLLNCLLGDLKFVRQARNGLEELKGSPITIRGSVAYVQQVPWI